MEIVRGKTSKKRQPKGKATAEDKFNRAWKRVQNQQRKNERFLEDAERFAREVEQEIGERERRYAESLYAGCEHLITFYGRKSLLLWQRQTLMEWLSDDIMALTASPFSGHLDLAALQEKLVATVEKVHPQEEFAQDPLEDPMREEPEEPAADADTAEEDQRTADMFEDLFADFEQDDEDFEEEGSEEDDPFGFNDDDPFEEFFKGQRAHEEARREKSRSLSQLLKGSSINRLFRKLARVLHPDLERDDAAREHKNHLMSELIEARNSNDIPRIFSLYAEHVGESPLSELDGDLDTATLLLHEQYQELRDRQEDQLAENPRLAMIYQRFYHKNPRRVQQSIRQHMASLEELISSQRSLMAEVTSLNKLKPYLEERYAMNMVDGLDFMYEFYD